MSKIFHISHSDLDGISCVLLNRIANEDKEVHTYYADYEQLYPVDQKFTSDWYEFLQEEGPFDEILVTDIACDLDMFLWIKNTFPKYRIFDHHERSMHLEGQENCYVSIDCCATKLYFDYIFQGKRTPVLLRHYVDHVNTYDLYSDEKPNWKSASDLNRVYWGALKYQHTNYLRYENFINFQLQKLYGSGTEWYWGEFENVLIQKALDKEDSEYRIAKASSKTGIDEKGNKFIVWMGASKISIVCYKFLQDNPDVRYIVNINTYSGSIKRAINGKLSLRSRKEDKEFSICDLDGCAGHQSAGGARFTVERIEALWADPTKEALPYRKEETPA